MYFLKSSDVWQQKGSGIHTKRQQIWNYEKSANMKSYRLTAGPNLPLTFRKKVVFNCFKFSLKNVRHP